MALIWRPALAALHLRCPFKLFFQVPCPSCGMTRQAAALLTGKVSDAFFYNPGSALLGLALAAYLLADIRGYHRGLTPVLAMPGRRLLSRVALPGLLLNWSYLIYTRV